MASDSQVELLPPALVFDLPVPDNDRIDQLWSMTGAKVRVGLFELLRHQPRKLFQEIWTDLASRHGLLANVVIGRRDLFPVRLCIG